VLVHAPWNRLTPTGWLCADRINETEMYVQVHQSGHHGHALEVNHLGLGIVVCVQYFRLRADGLDAIAFNHNGGLVKARASGTINNAAVREDCFHLGLERVMLELGFRRGERTQSSDSLAALVLNRSNGN